MSGTDIVRALDHAALTFVSEADLQAEIAAALDAAGIAALREVRLSDGRSRIDLVAGTTGVEVKIDGSRSDVLRQLLRYAKCPELDELVLVTTRTKHHHLPASLDGKPVHLVSLIGSAL